MTHTTADIDDSTPMTRGELLEALAELREESHGSRTGTILAGLILLLAIGLLGSIVVRDQVRGVTASMQTELDQLRRDVAIVRSVSITLPKKVEQALDEPEDALRSDGTAARADANPSSNSAGADSNTPGGQGRAAPSELSLEPFDPIAPLDPVQIDPPAERFSDGDSSAKPISPKRRRGVTVAAIPTRRPVDTAKVAQEENPPSRPAAEVPARKRRIAMGVSIAPRRPQREGVIRIGPELTQTSTTTVSGVSP